MKTLLALAAMGFGSLFMVIGDSTYAQATAFTYQGRLNDGNAPANGSYDLSFTLFPTNTGGSALAGPLTNSATAITNGLFSTTLDFGNAFDGTARWLEIGVRTNGAASFATLVSRQPLTPTPYAIAAYTASNLSGTLPASQLQRRLFYVTGNSPVGWTTVSSTPVLVSGRTLTFTKLSSTSRLRITYGDNLGLNTSGVGASWEVKLDAASISPPLAMSLWNGGSSGTVMLQPGSLTGYATGVAAGGHTLAVYNYGVGGASVNTYTGWTSSFLLEVEEIQ